MIIAKPSNDNYWCWSIMRGGLPWPAIVCVIPRFTYRSRGMWQVDVGLRSRKHTLRVVR